MKHVKSDCETASSSSHSRLGFNAVFILGMHRSGSSALTGSLQEYGLYLGSVSKSGIYNQKGNRENAAIVKLNDEILVQNGGDWCRPPKLITKITSEMISQRDQIIQEFETEANGQLWGCKDPRMILNYSFWVEKIPKIGLVGSFRHPLAVAHSLLTRDKIPLEKGLEIWTEYNRPLVTLIKKEEFPIVCFDVSSNEYLNSIKRVADYLKLPGLKEGQESSFFTDELRHEGDSKRISLPEETDAIYQFLLKVYREQSTAYQLYGTQILKRALATKPALHPSNKTFSGAVYQSNGLIWPPSLRTNRQVVWKPSDPPELSEQQPAKWVAGKSIYLGHLSTHYGHFLTETLARFWALDHGEKFDHYVFHPFTAAGEISLPFSPMDLSMECFNFTSDQLIIIHELTCFESLIVPGSALEINNQCLPIQYNTYKRIAQFCATRFTDSVKTSERVYLSRSHLNGYRPIENEDEVERSFASLGFTIIHPEQMPFGEQVACYHNARILAGLTGSAMHNVVFLRPGSQAIHLGNPRNPLRLHQNQKMLDSLASIHSSFIPFKPEENSEFPSGTRIDIPHLQMQLGKLL